MVAFSVWHDAPTCATSMKAFSYQKPLSDRAISAALMLVTADDLKLAISGHAAATAVLDAAAAADAVASAWKQTNSSRASIIQCGRAELQTQILGEGRALDGSPEVLFTLPCTA